MGERKRTVRKRATGIREQVVAFLTEAGGEIYDRDGMASRSLAEAVRYPGSSIAFAQLLSGMERAGIITREVRGKRTYRITLGDFDGFGPAPPRLDVPVAQVDPVPAGDNGTPPMPEFDYDELARRLLVQVARKLASEPDPDLVAENVRLREELREAQQSLAMARALANRPVR